MKYLNGKYCPCHADKLPLTNVILPAQAILQEYKTFQLFANNKQFQIRYYILIYCPVLLVIPPGAHMNTS